MIKKLLQISNDFADQKIYVNLVRRVSESGLAQVIYVPVRWEEKINGNRDDSIKNVIYHYSHILKRSLIFKLRFHRKISIILKDLESKVDLKDVGLVHAHFLFSDGAVAFRLKKKYNIPYIVSVRATDIHTFFRYMIHLRPLGNRIIDEAEKVIFINPSYKDIFNRKYKLPSTRTGGNKLLVIPNAIDDTWFRRPLKPKKPTEIVRLIYVGRIIRRKKLDIVIKALKRLNSENDGRFRLEVEGEGSVKEAAEKIADENVNFYGKISDTKDLIKIYDQSHIFVMPAIRETFGLVYIEAMSQGLPIIFCKGEGVDGFFEEDSVGRAVTPHSVSEVCDAVLGILADYSSLSSHAHKYSRKFNWKEITDQYVKIYQASLSRN
ncbi:MAG: glycosyltransferase family 4 protein [Flavobacteriaceae bacterium]